MVNIRLLLLLVGSVVALHHEWHAFSSTNKPPSDVFQKEIVIGLSVVTRILKGELPCANVELLHPQFRDVQLVVHDEPILSATEEKVFRDALCDDDRLITAVVETQTGTQVDLIAVPGGNEGIPVVSFFANPVSPNVHRFPTVLYLKTSVAYYYENLAVWLRSLGIQNVAMIYQLESDRADSFSAFQSVFLEHNITVGVRMGITTLDTDVRLAQMREFIADVQRKRHHVIITQMGPFPHLPEFLHLSSTTGLLTEGNMIVVNKRPFETVRTTLPTAAPIPYLPSLVDPETAFSYGESILLMEGVTMFADVIEQDESHPLQSCVRAHWPNETQAWFPEEPRINPVYPAAEIVWLAMESVFMMAQGMNRVAAAHPEVEDWDTAWNETYSRQVVDEVLTAPMDGPGGRLEFDADTHARDADSIFGHFENDTFVHAATVSELSVFAVQPPKFLGLTAAIPRDVDPDIVREEITVSFSNYVIGGVMGGVVALLGLTMVVFVVANRKHRDIRSSSATALSVVLCGCIGFALCTWLAPGYWKTAVMCHVRAWAVGCAYVTVFGMLYVKTMWVHKVVKSAWIRKQRMTLLRAIFLVACLVVVETLVSVVWVAQNAMEVYHMDGSATSIDGIQTQFYSTVCKSNPSTFSIGAALWVFTKFALGLAFLHMSYKARKLPEQVNETVWLSNIGILNVILLVVFTTMKGVLNIDASTAFWFDVSVLLMYALFPWAMLIVPKLSDWEPMKLGAGIHKVSGERARTSAGSHHSSHHNPHQSGSYGRGSRRLTQQDTRAVTIERGVLGQQHKTTSSRTYSGTASMRPLQSPGSPRRITSPSRSDTPVALDRLVPGA